MVTLERYFEIMLDRPAKLSEEETEYGPAPAGSAMICCNCLNYYLRSRDRHAVCQVMRPLEEDKGVYPDWRCLFFTTTGDVFPFAEEEPETALPDDPKIDDDDIPF